MRNIFVDSLKKRIGLLVSLAVLIVVGFTLIKEWESLKNFPWSINIFNVLISLICYATQLAIMFYIWHLIIKTISNQSELMVNLNAFFLSAIAKRIPTPLPFVGVRFDAYKNNQGKSKVVIVGSVLEIITLITAGLVITILFVIIKNIGLTNSLWLIWLIALIIVVVFTPWVFTKIYSQLVIKIDNKFLLNPPRNKEIYLWIFLSFISYIINGLMIFFAISGITNLQVLLTDVIIPASIYYLLTYVTMYLFGGFGIKEIVFGLMLNKIILFPVAVLISIVIRLFMILVELLAFVIIRKFYQRDIKPFRHNLLS